MCKQNQFVAESNLYHSWLAALPATENRDGHVPQFITSPAASFRCLQHVSQETCLCSPAAESGENVCFTLSTERILFFLEIKFNYLMCNTESTYTHPKSNKVTCQVQSGSLVAPATNRLSGWSRPHMPKCPWGSLNAALETAAAAGLFG